MHHYVIWGGRARVEGYIVMQTFAPKTATFMVDARCECSRGVARDVRDRYVDVSEYSDEGGVTAVAETHRCLRRVFHAGGSERSREHRV